jgi:hypothetical protein
MKGMCWRLVDTLEELNPDNSVALTAIIYLERMLRLTEIRDTKNDHERAGLMYRTYILALHFAFIFLDDHPWSLVQM